MYVVHVDFIGLKNVIKFIVTRFFSYSPFFHFYEIQCDDTRIGEKKTKEDTVYFMRIYLVGKPLLLSINMKYER